MPSGKTHDRITFLLILPTFFAAYLLTYQLEVSLLATLAMLFGGLMFGPDLDISSRQYYRWGYLRLIWWPYQRLFSHRSIFTHGIVVGTVVRIGYFCLVVALIALIEIQM
ncbi:MAG: putative metal-binding protein [bacterium]|nr:MAG: putative metal-binding protein [bacterium]